MATGMDTEMGKIADALNDSKDGDTPLRIKLNQLSKIAFIPCSRYLRVYLRAGCYP